MAKPSSTFTTIICIAMFLIALLIVVREYTSETTGHLSQDITTRLAEVSRRVADDFDRNIDSQLNELQNITSLKNAFFTMRPCCVQQALKNSHSSTWTAKGFALTRVTHLTWRALEKKNFSTMRSVGLRALPPFPTAREARSPLPFPLAEMAR